MTPLQSLATLATVLLEHYNDDELDEQNNTNHRNMNHITHDKENLTNGTFHRNDRPPFTQHRQSPPLLRPPKRGAAMMVLRDCGNIENHTNDHTNINSHISRNYAPAARSSNNKIHDVDTNPNIQNNDANRFDKTYWSLTDNVTCRNYSNISRSGNDHPYHYPHQHYHSYQPQDSIRTNHVYNDNHHPNPNPNNTFRTHHSTGSMHRDVHDTFDGINNDVVNDIHDEIDGDDTTEDADCCHDGDDNEYDDEEEEENDENTHSSTGKHDNNNNNNDDDDDSDDDDEKPPPLSTVSTSPVEVTSTSSTIPYYMDRNWIPTTAGSTHVDPKFRQQKNSNDHNKAMSHTTDSSLRPPQQVPPQTIRSQLQQYMKHHPHKRKTKLLQDLGVNSNSFRKFMDPNNYKDQWRAVENGTYMAAARYLEAERVHPNRRNTSVVIPPISTIIPKAVIPPTKKKKKPKKRKHLPSSPSTTVSGGSPPMPQPAQKRYKKSHREDAIQYIKSINAISLHSITPSASVAESECTNHVYGSMEHRAYITQQVEEFLDLPGVSKSNFCFVALNGINRKALEKMFKPNPSHEGLTDDVFRRVCTFFEKKRVYDDAH